MVIDTVVCLTLAKWETVSGQFGGYLTSVFGFTNSGSVTVSAGASSEGELSIRGGTVTNAKTIQVVANGQSHVFGVITAAHIRRTAQAGLSPPRAGSQCSIYA